MAWIAQKEEKRFFIVASLLRIKKLKREKKLKDIFKIKNVFKLKWLSH